MTKRTDAEPSPIPPPKRTARVQLRATPAQQRLLKQAAAAAGVPLGRFVMDNACSAAYRLLAERPDFLMDDPDWEHFLGLLDQPSSELTHLKKLLSEPA